MTYCSNDACAGGSVVGRAARGARPRDPGSFCTQGLQSLHQAPVCLVAFIRAPSYLALHSCGWSRATPGVLPRTMATSWPCGCCCAHPLTAGQEREPPPQQEPRPDHAWSMPPRPPCQASSWLGKPSARPSTRCFGASGHLLCRGHCTTWSKRHRRSRMRCCKTRQSRSPGSTCMAARYCRIRSPNTGCPTRSSQSSRSQMRPPRCHTEPSRTVPCTRTATGRCTPAACSPARPRGQPGRSQPCTRCTAACCRRTLHNQPRISGRVLGATWAAWHLGRTRGRRHKDTHDAIHRWCHGSAVGTWETATTLCLRTKHPTTRQTEDTTKMQTPQPWMRWTHASGHVCTWPDNNSWKAKKRSTPHLAWHLPLSSRA